ncbi:hypothetical protein [Providencia burhodogranariea]|uniref:Uncharacterized protein n=1 Tax=Providencia burhodogranariea DSM 19968 TaxID=1141662 RepID=K8WXH2_9GAMM|nr:hypothetical protein [Providencia burhodogranariea]EKT64626.1 hypothetical protein OOA_02477 [Providencia burhodogranariea DSM 19968]
MFSNISIGIYLYERMPILNEKYQSSREIKQANTQSLKNCESHFQQSDSLISTLDLNSEPTLDVFTMIANHQQQVVLAMLGHNPEQAIALQLQASIDIYASQLNYIYGWTQGGKEMFGSSLEMMFSALEEKGLQGVDYEDMFHLVMLDALLHAEEYGIDDTTLTKMSHLLEKSGSGGHNTWDYTPEQLGQMAEEIWAALYNSSMPVTSLAYKAMSSIAGGPPSSTMPDVFKKQFTSEVYNDPSQGGWLVENGNNSINPMVKMVIMSNLLTKYTLDQNMMERFLKTSSLEEIDQIVYQATDGKYTGAINFLFTEDKNWQDLSDPKKPLPDGVTVALDYRGMPNAAYLKTLYQDLVGREISESELEEINRIGDQVKMLQQTLKYWTQLCCDEQLAMARNI